MSVSRSESLRAVLVRTGIQDSTLAVEMVAKIEELSRGSIESAPIAESLVSVADPDLALQQLVRVLEAANDQQRNRLVGSLSADTINLGRLLQILGLSLGLGEFLIRHPECDSILDSEALAEPPVGIRERIMQSVDADPLSVLPIASGNSDEVLNALRIAYRRELLAIASRDLSGGFAMEVIAGWLSDLADAVLQAGLAVARSGVSDPACPLAIIAMGKTGGRELNYVSDVDVIFATDATQSLEIANALARGVIHACGAVTTEGAIWEVDTALRPEGKQGALVRTVESHAGYYERWASTWEFQALLKARFVAGDPLVGEEYMMRIQPFVWAAADRKDFVPDVQAMRRRVEDNVDSTLAARELKLGPGGLRDIEFSVQQHH